MTAILIAITALLAVLAVAVLAVAGWCRKIAEALEARPPRQAPAADAIAARVERMSAEELAAFLLAFHSSKKGSNRPVCPGGRVTLATRKIQ